MAVVVRLKTGVGEEVDAGLLLYPDGVVMSSMARILDVLDWCDRCLHDSSVFSRSVNAIWSRLELICETELESGESEGFCDSSLSRLMMFFSFRFTIVDVLMSSLRLYSSSITLRDSEVEGTG